MRLVVTWPKTYYFIIQGEKTGNEAEPVRVHTGLFCFCIRFHDTESKIHWKPAYKAHNSASSSMFSIGVLYWFPWYQCKICSHYVMICFRYPVWSWFNLNSQRVISVRRVNQIPVRLKIFWFLINTDSNCVKAGVSLTAETEPNWALFNVEKHALSYMV